MIHGPLIAEGNTAEVFAWGANHVGSFGSHVVDREGRYGGPSGIKCVALFKNRFAIEPMLEECDALCQPHEILLNHHVLKLYRPGYPSSEAEREANFVRVEL